MNWAAAAKGGLLSHCCFSTRRSAGVEDMGTRLLVSIVLVLNHVGAYHHSHPPRRKAPRSSPWHGASSIPPFGLGRRAAVLVHQSSSSSSGGGGGGGGDSGTTETPTVPSSDSDSITADAATPVDTASVESPPMDPALLQAQKLRLEAERDELLLEKERLTASLEAIKATDRFVNRLVEAESLEDAYRNYKRKITPELFRRMDERIAQEEDEARGRQLKAAFDGLLKLVDDDDENLGKSVRSAVSMPPAQTQASNTSKAVPYTPEMELKALMTFMSGNMSQSEIEAMVESQFENNGFNGFPAWGPDSLAQILRQPDLETIPESTIPRLKEEVFKDSRFYVTGVEFWKNSTNPSAVLVKGNVKNGSNADLYEEILERFNAVPELSDNLRLFFQMFPQDFTQATMMDDFWIDAGETKPVFIAMAKSSTPAQDGLGEIAFSFASLLGTMFTSLACGVGAFALNEDFVKRVSDGDTAVVADVLPLWGGLIALQWLPELGHLIAAAFYGTRLSWPVMVPSLQLGSFGGITKFLSFPKNRRELFDVSVAGTNPLVVTSLLATQ